MNFEHLKTFYITAQYNSISKAAKSLHMSQPGVSMQIQALEKELNFQLLERSNKGVQLTEAGQVVYDYAISILSIHDNLERQLESLKKHKIELAISSCTTIGSYILPCSLYLFKEKYPHVSLCLDINNSTNVVTNIINGVAKIGIIEGRPDCTKDIVMTKITSSTLKLVTSPKFLKTVHITYQELLELPLILREKGSGTRTIFTSSVNQKGLNLDNANIVMELSSAEAIKSAVISGKGLSVLPYLSVKKELATGILKEVKLEDISFKADYFFIYFKECTLNNAEKEFIINAKKGFC